MRGVLRIIGVVLAVTGLVLGLQGIGVLQGSRMSGEGFWAGAGLVTLIVGLVLLYLGMRPQHAHTT